MARVLDLAGASAAFGTRLLAEAGHEVVRVEEATSMGSLDIEDRAYCEFMHAGKTAISLDLSSESGRQHLLELAKDFDAIVIDDGKPIVPAQLTEANPQAVIIFIVDDDIELLLAARSGLLALTGHPGRSPRLPGGHVILAASGSYIAVATALALYQHGRSGMGQVVTVSIRQALESLVEQAMTDYTIAGKTTERRGSRGAITAVSGGLQCKDGYWMLSLIHSGEGWTRMMDWMQDPVLASDSELADEAKRHEKPDYILDRIEDWSRGIEQSRLIKEAQQHHIAASPVCTPLDLLNDEQLLARGFLQSIDHPACGSIPFPRGAAATVLDTPLKPYQWSEGAK